MLINVGWIYYLQKKASCQVWGKLPSTCKCVNMWQVNLIFVEESILPGPSLRQCNIITRRQTQSIRGQSDSRFFLPDSIFFHPVPEFMFLCSLVLKFEHTYFLQWSGSGSVLWEISRIQIRVLRRKFAQKVLKKIKF